MMELASRILPLVDRLRTARRSPIRPKESTSDVDLHREESDDLRRHRFRHDRHDSRRA
jgi:hypothetical protein